MYLDVAQSCYYASITEMLQVRAGFSPTYFQDDPSLRVLIDGSASNCSLEPRSSSRSSNSSTTMLCPQAPLGTFSRIQSLSQLEFIEDSGCGDQDVAYMVLRKTCLNESFLSSTPALRFFEARGHCEDVADICTCAPNETNPKDEGCNLQSPTSVAEHRFNVSRVWILLLRRLCPGSCGIFEKGNQCGKAKDKGKGKGTPKGR